MIRTDIEIPKNIKYLGEIRNIELPYGTFDRFELPNGILNKDVPNCGARTLALEDNHKTIICSPRNNLLQNKSEQYPNVLLVIGGVNINEVRTYIEQTEIPKILVSYDSIYKLTECIKDTTDWRIVVDEFQYMLADSGFKSEVELKLLEHLKRFPYVTYLSATPILDKYLEQIDYFKDMNYYHLIWTNKEVVKVYRERSNNPISAAIEIVRSYQNKNYPSVFMDGETYYSKECVIFLNSVSNIVNIVKQTKLLPDEVNIIVGSSEENDKSIAKLGNGFQRGRIPLKGETHKMITFCTSTAFAGCDFYSTNASTFVISDCKRINTAIDISTDLVQIAGRQRLACNPFRKFLTFIYNVNKEDVSEDEFRKYLDDKVYLTEREVDSNNDEADIQLRTKRIRDCLREQKMLQYQDSYTMYDKSSDRFVFNKLAYISEQYAYELQKYNYRNGIIVKKQLSENDFDVTENQTYGIYKEQLKHIVKKETFVDRMTQYCEYKSKGLCFDLAAFTLEQKYPELKYYYDELGGNRIKALGYKEKELKNEISIRHSDAKIRYKMGTVFQMGMELTTDRIKELMNEVYQKVGVKKKGKATDLEKLYGFKIHPCKILLDDGSRKNGYKIIGV